MSSYVEVGPVAPDSNTEVDDETLTSSSITFDWEFLCVQASSKPASAYIVENRIILLNYAVSLVNQIAHDEIQ